MTELKLQVMKGPQEDFLNSEAKFPALFSGRGGGKTWVSTVKLFKYVNDHPGADGVFTAPTFPMIDQSLLPTVRRIFGDVEGTYWVWREAKHEIVFPTLNSTVFVRPGEEADRFRGMNIAFGALDEIGVGYQHDSFMVLQPALRQEGFPHQMWVTTTPRYQQPWIKQRWVDHVNPHSRMPLTAEHYPYWHQPTYANWHLPEGQKELLEESYGGTPYAAQELLGEFVAIEGAAFPHFLYETHVREPVETKWTKQVIGIDFGSASPHSMHLLKMDQSRRLWVTKEFYQRNVDEFAWVETVRDWMETDGVKRVVVDPSISEDDLKALRRTYGIHFQRARSKRFDLRVRLWNSRLKVRETAIGQAEPNIYIDPICLNLIEELPNAGFAKPRGQEYNTEGFRPGTQDHAIDDVAYAMMEFDAIGATGRPRATLVMA
jgi:hypothetical protein